MELRFADGRVLGLDRPRIVGILNLTPDSFSDGGKWESVDRAAAAAEMMLAQGADLIDVGGESTRPGAQRVDADEQCRRVLAAIERIVERTGALVSIDTTLSAVAEAALDVGAVMVNDVSAGSDDPTMLELIARRGAPCVLMHMRGRPADMQIEPTYDHVVADVAAFLCQRMAAAREAGVTDEQIVVDPGIGFGKTTEHNLELLAAVDRFVALGRPVMLGASRKRFIGQVAEAPDPTQRVAGTAATTALGVLAGVHLFRVHDVAANRQAADVTFAITQHRTVE